MLRKRTSRERVNIAKKSFLLPVGITSETVLLSDEVLVWIFRHHQLGQIGRAVIFPHPKGVQCHYEVLGDSSDSMTLERRAVFEPLVKYIASSTSSIGLVSDNIEINTESYDLKQDIVEMEVDAKTITCYKCDKPAATIFVASDVYTADHLEDYARITFAKIKELNVPAWIVGSEKEVVINGDLAGEALALKVWPIREAAKIISSIEFNTILEELLANHCT